MRIAQHILMPEVKIPILANISRVLVSLPSRIVRIVVNRQIPNTPRKAHRQPTRRRCAIQDISEGISSLLARIHLQHERSCRIRDPRFRDWLAGLEDDDGGFACLHDCLDEGAHGADEGEVIDVDVFACGGVKTFLS